MLVCAQKNEKENSLKIWETFYLNYLNLLMLGHTPSQILARISPMDPKSNIYAKGHDLLYEIY
jgi:hypothetical protein